MASRLQEALKGFVIVTNLTLGTIRIEKDGVFIAHAKSVADAKTQIDLLVAHSEGGVEAVAKDLGFKMFQSTL
jgi:hypothetical protein